MTTAPTMLLASQGAYRGAAVVAHGQRGQAGRHLRAASEALSLAVLTLGEAPADHPAAKRHRADTARSFLVEAVTALSRARIYVRGVHTHALPVVLASERNPDAELGRLYEIATRLLWKNHAYLPAKAQAKPLPPDEEAQLAVLLDGLARSARIARVTRYKWLGAGAMALGVGFAIGAPLVGSAVGLVTIAGGLWQLRRERGALAQERAV